MNTIKKLLTSCNIAETGVIALLGIYPLFITNYYFNITVSKMTFFAVTASCAFFICSIVRVSSNDFVEVAPSQALKKTTGTDWAMFVFLFASAVSWVISDYRDKAFIGASGRYMGFTMMVFMAFAYLFIAKFYVIKERDFYVFAAAFAIVAGIGVLEFVGFDPFGIITATPEKYRNNFLSLLGNLNVFSSFMCIAGAFAMYRYCSELKRLKSAIWLAVSCFGFLGLFVCNSDSGYLGFGAAFVVCAYLALKDGTVLKKLPRLAAAFFIVGKALWLFCDSTSRETRSFSPVTRAVISPSYTYVIIAVFVLAALILWRVKLPQKSLKPLRIIYVAGVMAAAAGVVGAIVYFSVFDLETELGGLEYVLRFNDDWGTFRGTVWRWTLSSFSDFPFIHKLFGAGEETLALVLREGFAQEIAETQLNFDNAHNEFMQYLATIGIVGVGGYIAALVLCVRKLLVGVSATKTALGVAIIAFAAQSFINILQPITSPLIFVFIGLMHSREECPPSKEKT